MNHRKKEVNSVLLIFLAAMAIMIIVASNVFLVTIGKIHLRSGTDLSVYADSANTVTTITKALRGDILASDGTIIAEDNRTYNIVCILDPNRPAVEGEVAYVQDKEETATQLGRILKMDPETVLEFLNQDVYQTELGSAGRNLSEATKNEIEALNLPGIEFTDSITRVYPLGTFASNLIGFAQSNEYGSTVGKMGTELYLNDYLMGTDGLRTYQADKNGYILPGMREEVTAAVNGNDVYLTLDPTIQEAMEEAFEMTENTFGSSRIWAAVMEISTGRLLAWGQYPSFDPNTLEITDYNNYGAQVPYEPGSTLKTFTWAAAINEGKYDGSALVYSGPYYYTVDENNDPVRAETSPYVPITNASNWNRGWIDYDHGLIYSSNVIAAEVQNSLITPEIHLEYMKKFGFFQPVSTDGLAEETGILNFTWPADKLALSFGQGSTVTTLQMLQAYSAVFGDGTMKRPYYIESIRDPYDSNKILYQAQTKITGQPITAETAQQLQEILTRVVNDDDGTARFYKIPECTLMGKTGTSEVAVNGSYMSGYTIPSIMCALPAEDPQVMVYYASEAPYSPNAHYNTEATVHLLRTVARTLGYTSSEDEETTDQETSQAEETAPVTLRSAMPDLVNHTLDYAAGKLESMGADVLTLGAGTTVINQYPEAGETVFSGQKVILLTDTNSFVMPDLTGWTRRDVTALWQVTQFGFKLSGEGTVVAQNISAGTTVTRGTQIEVQFG
jgi:penicillin-binding protein 2B